MRHAHQGPGGYNPTSTCSCRKRSTSGRKSRLTSSRCSGSQCTTSVLVGKHTPQAEIWYFQPASPNTLFVPALPAGLYLVRLLHDGIAEYRKLLAE
jgi:hypothetical protein